MGQSSGNYDILLTTKLKAEWDENDINKLGQVLNQLSDDFNPLNLSDKQENELREKISQVRGMFSEGKDQNGNSFFQFTDAVQQLGTGVIPHLIGQVQSFGKALLDVVQTTNKAQTSARAENRLATGYRKMLSTSSNADQLSKLEFEKPGISSLYGDVVKLVSKRYSTLAQQEKSSLFRETWADKLSETDWLRNEIAALAKRKNIGVDRNDITKLIRSSVYAMGPRSKIREKDSIFAPLYESAPITGNPNDIFGNRQIKALYERGGKQDTSIQNIPQESQASYSAGLYKSLRALQKRGNVVAEQLAVESGLAEYVNGKRGLELSWSKAPTQDQLRLVLARATELGRRSRGGQAIYERDADLNYNISKTLADVLEITDQYAIRANDAKNGAKFTERYITPAGIELMKNIPKVFNKGTITSKANSTVGRIPAYAMPYTTLEEDEKGNLTFVPRTRDDMHKVVTRTGQLKVNKQDKGIMIQNSQLTRMLGLNPKNSGSFGLGYDADGKAVFYDAAGTTPVIVAMPMDDIFEKDEHGYLKNEKILTETGKRYQKSVETSPTYNGKRKMFVYSNGQSAFYADEDIVKARVNSAINDKGLSNPLWGYDPTTPDFYISGPGGYGKTNKHMTGNKRMGTQGSELQDLFPGYDFSGLKFGTISLKAQKELNDFLGTKTYGTKLVDGAGFIDPRYAPYSFQARGLGEGLKGVLGNYDWREYLRKTVEQQYTPNDEFVKLSKADQDKVLSIVNDKASGSSKIGRYRKKYFNPVSSPFTEFDANGTLTKLLMPSVAFAQLPDDYRKAALAKIQMSMQEFASLDQKKRKEVEALANSQAGLKNITANDLLGTYFQDVMSSDLGGLLEAEMLKGETQMTVADYNSYQNFLIKQRGFTAKQAAAALKEKKAAGLIDTINGVKVVRLSKDETNANINGSLADSGLFVVKTQEDFNTNKRIIGKQLAEASGFSAEDRARSAELYAQRLAEMEDVDYWINKDQFMARPDIRRRFLEAENKEAFVKNDKQALEYIQSQILGTRKESFTHYMLPNETDTKLAFPFLGSFFENAISNANASVTADATLGWTYLQNLENKKFLRQKLGMSPGDINKILIKEGPDKGKVDIQRLLFDSSNKSKSVLSGRTPSAIDTFSSMFNLGSIGASLRSLKGGSSDLAMLLPEAIDRMNTGDFDGDTIWMYSHFSKAWEDNFERFNKFAQVSPEDAAEIEAILQEQKKELESKKLAGTRGERETDRAYIYAKGQGEMGKASAIMRNALDLYDLTTDEGQRKFARAYRLGSRYYDYATSEGQKEGWVGDYSEALIRGSYMAGRQFSRFQKMVADNYGVDPEDRDKNQPSIFKHRLRSLNNMQDVASAIAQAKTRMETGDDFGFSDFVDKWIEDEYGVGSKKDNEVLHSIASEYATILKGQNDLSHIYTREELMSFFDRSYGKLNTAIGKETDADKKKILQDELNALQGQRSLLFEKSEQEGGYGGSAFFKENIEQFRAKFENDKDFSSIYGDAANMMELFLASDLDNVIDKTGQSELIDKNLQKYRVQTEARRSHRDKTAGGFLNFWKDQFRTQNPTTTQIEKYITNPTKLPVQKARYDESGNLLLLNEGKMQEIAPKFDNKTWQQESVENDMKKIMGMPEATRVDTPFGTFLHQSLQDLVIGSEIERLNAGKKQASYTSGDLMKLVADKLINGETTPDGKTKVSWKDILTGNYAGQSIKDPLSEEEWNRISDYLTSADPNAKLVLDEGHNGLQEKITNAFSREPNNKVDRFFRYLYGKGKLFESETLHVNRNTKAAESAFGANDRVMVRDLLSNRTEDKSHYGPDLIWQMGNDDLNSDLWMFDWKPTGSAGEQSIYQMINYALQAEENSGNAYEKLQKAQDAKRLLKLRKQGKLTAADLTAAGFTGEEQQWLKYRDTEGRFRLKKLVGKDYTGYDPDSIFDLEQNHTLAELVVREDLKNARDLWFAARGIGGSGEGFFAGLSHMIDTGYIDAKDTVPEAIQKYVGSGMTFEEVADAKEAFKKQHRNTKGGFSGSKYIKDNPEEWNFLVARYSQDREKLAEITDRLRSTQSKYRTRAQTDAEYSQFDSLFEDLSMLDNPEMIGALEAVYKDVLPVAMRDIGKFVGQRDEQRNVLRTILDRAVTEDPRRTAEAFKRQLYGTKENDIYSQVQSIVGRANLAAGTRQTYKKPFETGFFKPHGEEADRLWAEAAEIEKEYLKYSDKDNSDEAKAARDRRREFKENVLQKRYGFDKGKSKDRMSSDMFMQDAFKYADAQEGIDILRSTERDLINRLYEDDRKQIENEVDLLTHRKETPGERIQKRIDEARTNIDNSIASKKLDLVNADAEAEKYINSLSRGFSSDDRDKLRTAVQSGDVATLEGFKGTASTDDLGILEQIQLIVNRKKTLEDAISRLNQYLGQGMDDLSNEFFKDAELELGMRTKTPEEIVDKWRDERLKLRDAKDKYAQDLLTNGKFDEYFAFIKEHPSTERASINATADAMLERMNRERRDRITGYSNELTGTRLTPLDRATRRYNSTRDAIQHEFDSLGDNDPLKNEYRTLLYGSQGLWQDYRARLRAEEYATEAASTQRQYASGIRLGGELEGRYLTRDEQIAAMQAKLIADNEAYIAQQIRDKRMTEAEANARRAMYTPGYLGNVAQQQVDYEMGQRDLSLEQKEVTATAKFEGRGLSQDEKIRLRTAQMQQERNQIVNEYRKRGQRRAAAAYERTYSDSELDRIARREVGIEEALTDRQLQSQLEQTRLNNALAFEQQRHTYQMQNRNLYAHTTPRIVQNYRQQADIRWGLRQTIDKNRGEAFRVSRDIAEKEAAFRSRWGTSSASYTGSNQEARKQAAEIARANEELNRYNTTASQAAEQMQKFSGPAMAMRSAFATIGDTVNSLMQRLGRRMFMKAISEVKRFVQDFDKSMTSIQMITLKSDEQMATLGDGLIEKAKELKISISEITQSAETLYRQGLSDQEVNERLEVISKFSKVSGTKVDAATKLITVAMNTGLVSDPSTAADIVTALGDTAATNAAEIEKGIEKAGAAAAADGTTFAELAAMLTAITSTTQIGGNVAGRTLNTIFGRMNKIGTNELIYDENGNAVSGSAVAKLLKAQGISQYDENGRKRSSYETLYALSQRWEKMSDAEQQQMANAIAGTRQYSNFAAIMQGMAEGKVSEYMETVGESEGIVDKKYEIYAKSLQASLTELKNTFDELVNDLVDNGGLTAFLDTVTRIIKGVDNLSNSLGGLGGVLTLIIPMFAALAAFKFGMSTGNIGLMALGLVGGVATVSVFNSLGSGTTKKEQYDNAADLAEKRYSTIDSKIEEAKKLRDKGTSRTAKEEQKYTELISDLASSLNLEDPTKGVNEFTDALNNVADAASSAAKRNEDYSRTIKEAEEANEADRIKNLSLLSSKWAGSAAESLGDYRKAANKSPTVDSKYLEEFFVTDENGNRTVDIQKFFDVATLGFTGDINGNELQKAFGEVLNNGLSTPILGAILDWAMPGTRALRGANQDEVEYSYTKNRKRLASLMSEAMGTVAITDADLFSELTSQGYTGYEEEQWLSYLDAVHAGKRMSTLPVKMLASAMKTWGDTNTIEQGSKDKIKEDFKSEFKSFLPNLEDTQIEAMAKKAADDVVDLEQNAGYSITAAYTSVLNDALNLSSGDFSRTAIQAAADIYAASAGYTPAEKISKYTYNGKVYDTKQAAEEARDRDFEIYKNNNAVNKASYLMYNDRGYEVGKEDEELQANMAADRQAAIDSAIDSFVEESYREGKLWNGQLRSEEELAGMFQTFKTSEKNKIFEQELASYTDSTGKITLGLNPTDLYKARYDDYKRAAIDAASYQAVVSNFIKNGRVDMDALIEWYENQPFGQTYETFSNANQFGTSAGYVYNGTPYQTRALAEKAQLDDFWGQVGESQGFYEINGKRYTSRAKAIEGGREYLQKQWDESHKIDEESGIITYNGHQYDTLEAAEEQRRKDFYEAEANAIAVATEEEVEALDPLHAGAATGYNTWASNKKNAYALRAGSFLRDLQSAGVIDINSMIDYLKTADIADWRYLTSNDESGELARLVNSIQYDEQGNVINPEVYDQIMNVLYSNDRDTGARVLNTSQKAAIAQNMMTSIAGGQKGYLSWEAALQDAQKEEQKAIDEYEAGINNMVDARVASVTGFYSMPLEWQEEQRAKYEAEYRRQTPYTGRTAEQIAAGYRIYSEDEEKYLREILGDELYQRVSEGTAPAEEIAYASMLVGNRAYGLTSLTAGQQLQGIKDVRAAIAQNRFGIEGGYSTTIADQFMSQWSGWGEYSALLKRQAAGEELTDEDLKRLQTLETSLDNFQKNAEIKFDIEGIQQLEEAGEVTAGLSSEIEKLRKGGKVALEVIMKYRTEGFEEGQKIAKLYNGTVTQQDEAAMAILGMSREQYFADRTGNLQRAMATEQANRRINANDWTKRYQNALNDEQRRDILEAANSAGYDLLAEGYTLRNGVVYDSKGRADYAATMKYRNGEFSYSGAPTISNISSLVGQARTYTEAEKNNALDKIISGEMKRTNANAELYDAAISAGGVYTQELLRRQANNERVDEWLEIASRNERESYRTKQYSDYYSKNSQMRQAQWALGNMTSPEAAGYLSIFLGMDESQVKNLMGSEDGKNQLQEKFKTAQQTLYSEMAQALDVQLDTSDMTTMKEQLQEAADNAEGLLKAFLQWMADSVDEAGNVIGAAGNKSFSEVIGESQSAEVKKRNALNYVGQIIQNGNYGALLEELSGNGAVDYGQLNSALLYMLNNRAHNGAASPFTDEMINNAYQNELMGRSSAPQTQQAILSTLFGGNMNAANMINTYQEWMKDPEKYAAELGALNGLEGFDNVKEALASETNAVDKTTEAFKKYNQEMGVKALQYANAFGDSTDDVTASLANLAKGGKTAQKELASLSRKVYDTQDAMTAWYEANNGGKAKSGKKMSKKGRKAIADYLGISDSEVEKFTKEDMEMLFANENVKKGIQQDMSDSANTIFNEAWNDVQAQLQNGGFDIGGQKIITIADAVEFVFNPDGSVNMDNLIALAQACESDAISLLQSLAQGKLGEWVATLKQSGTGDTYKAWIEAKTTTGAQKKGGKYSYNNRGGSGGGGGKSAAQQAIEASKHYVGLAEHKNNMAEAGLYHPDKVNDYDSFGDAVATYMFTQNQLAQVQRDQIAALEAERAKVSEGTDDWWSLTEAINGYKESLEKLEQTMDEINKKMFEELKEQYTYKITSQQHDITMSDIDRTYFQRINDYEAEAKEIDSKIAKQQALARTYRDALAKVQGIRDVEFEANGQSDYWWELQQEADSLTESLAGLKNEMAELAAEKLSINVEIRTHGLVAPQQEASIMGYDEQILSKQNSYGALLSLYQAQLDNSAKQRKVYQDSIAANEALLKTQEEESDEWYATLAEIYNDQNSLLQLAVSDRETLAKRIDLIKEAYQTVFDELTHRENLITAQQELYNFDNDYKASFENLNSYIVNKRQTQDVIKDYISRLKAEQNRWETGSDEWNTLQTAIEEQEQQELKIRNDINNVWAQRLDILTKKQEKELSPLTHENTMLGYREQRYDRLNDYGAYTDIIAEENRVRKDMMATQRDQIAELQAEQKFVIEGTEAWWNLQNRINSVTEAYQENSKAIDENNKKRIDAMKQMQQNADLSQNHAFDVMNAIANRAQLLDDQEMYEGVIADRLNVIRDAISQNDTQVSQWETLLSTYVEGSDEWLEVRNTIWSIKLETAKLENEGLQLENDLATKRLANIQKNFKRQSGYYTHINTELDAAGKIYQSYSEYDNYRTALTQQIEAQKQVQQNAFAARDAILEQMATLEKGSQAWYDARDAAWSYDEQIENLTSTMLEKQQAIEASRIQEFTENYNDSQMQNNLDLAAIRAQRQIYDRAGDYENYKKQGLKEKEILEQQLADKRSYVEGLKQLLAETTKGTNQWKSLRNTIAQELANIANAEAEIDRINHEQTQSEIDHMLERMNWEDENRKHNLTMIRYEQSKYQNAGELSNYGLMLQKEEEVLRESIEAEKNNIARLNEKLLTLEEGSKEYKQVVGEIKKHEEALRSDTSELEKNTKEQKENAEAILKTRKNLEDAVDKELRTREEERKKRLDAEVKLQKTILDTIKDRYKDQWDLEQKDIEKKKEALEKEKSLINERLNVRKNAMETEEKYRELEELKRQLALISNDPTRTRDAKELSKRISDIEKDISWEKAFEEAEVATQQIDDEIQAMNDYVTVHGDNLNEMLENANNFADQIAAIMAGGWDSIDEFLTQNNQEFLNSTEQARQQMEEGWRETWETMTGYAKTYWDQVAEILTSYETFVAFMKDSTEYLTASDVGKQILEFGWETLYENWKKSGLISDEAENYETDDHPWTEGSVGSTIADILGDAANDWMNLGLDKPDEATRMTVISDYGDVGLDTKPHAVAITDLETGDTYTGIGITAAQEEAGKTTGTSQSVPINANEPNLEGTIPAVSTPNLTPDVYDATFNYDYSGVGVHYEEETPSEYAKVYSEAPKEYTATTSSISYPKKGPSSTGTSGGTAKADTKYYDIYDERGVRLYWQVEASSAEEAKQKLKDSQFGTGYYTTGGTPHDKQTEKYKFAHGGLVDFTGAAWVDGTPMKPESFLDSIDTKLIASLVDSLNYIRVNSYALPNSSILDHNHGSIGTVNVTINQAELKDDADFEIVAKHVGKAFTKELSRNGFNLTGYNL